MSHRTRPEVTFLKNLVRWYPQICWLVIGEKVLNSRPKKGCSSFIFLSHKVVGLQATSNTDRNQKHKVVFFD